MISGGGKIAASLNTALKAQKDDILVNLASNEYFKAVDCSILDGRIVTPVFKEKKDGKYKVIGLFAKRARGMMTDFIISNRLKKVDELKEFTEGGYSYDEKMSSEEGESGTLVFIR